MTTSSRPSLPDVRRAVAAALARGQRQLVDVAQILCVSASTLQRILADHQTDFTTLRKEVQVRIALEHLTAGRPAWFAAERAVLTRDHLRVIVRQATGLTPLQILRAAQISTTLERWRRHGPPPYGSWLYRHQFEQWQRFDAQLQDLFADFGPSHPLAVWAKRVLVAAERPDFRTKPYRDDRRRKAERRADQLQRLLEGPRLNFLSIATPSTSPPLAEVDSVDGD